MIKITRIVFSLVWLVMAAGLFYYHSRLILASRQQEYREGAILLTTQALLTNQNPYAPENQPLYTNVYGLVYNAMVLPLVAIFGNTFTVHRAVSGLAIVAAAIFLTVACVRKKIPLLFALSVGLTFYICQLFFITPLARPDGLGMLLLVVATLLPWMEDFNLISLIISGALGVLGFFTKTYFVLPIAYVGLYLFLFINKKKAVIYGLLSGGALLIVATIYWRVFPYYFYDTLLLHIEAMTRFWGYMVVQISNFTFWFSPLILLTLISMDWRNIGKTRPDLPLFAFLCSTVLVIVSFGHNSGSYMTYLFQLMTPFLVVAALQLLSRKPEIEILVYLSLLLTFYLLATNLFPQGFHIDYSRSENTWQKVDVLVAKNMNILNSPALSGELLKHDKPVIDSGHIEYYYAPEIPDLFFLPEPDDIQEHGEAFLENVHQAIGARQFDRVVITQGYSPFTEQADLELSYVLEGIFTLDMPHARQTWIIELWTPKP